MNMAELRMGVHGKNLRISIVEINSGSRVRVYLATIIFIVSILYSVYIS